jgi:hypothetical protein
MNSAPTRAANCTAARPTPPAALVTSIRSPAPTPARDSRLSAVPWLQGMAAISMSSSSAALLVREWGERRQARSTAMKQQADKP